jgi:hypothetical protein
VKEKKMIEISIINVSIIIILGFCTQISLSFREGQCEGIYCLKNEIKLLIINDKT